MPGSHDKFFYRFKLEKAMHEWYEAEGKQDRQRRFVLWGPAGTGKSTLALQFAAGQVESAAKPSVRLVFALSTGSNLAEGYAGLHGESSHMQAFLLALAIEHCWPSLTDGADKIQEDSSAAGSLVHEDVRKRVHEVLQSPRWSGRWLAVLDDLPSPSELEGAGLGWLLEEFPWSHGWTIITSRAAEWVQDDEDSREVTVAEAERRCDNCGQGSGAMQKCGQCRKVYYCSAVCQKQAWTVHKLVCVARPVIRCSVADIMGLGVGSFREDEACGWITGKVRQWRSEEAHVLKLVQHLECLPLAIGMVTAYARIHSKGGSVVNYLAALKQSERQASADEVALV